VGYAGLPFHFEQNPTLNMTAAAAGSAADSFLSQKQVCMIFYLIL
jgi:hypothetical protein